ncbi:MAG: hypothetical protein ACOCXJ_07755 [Planctomycetota bacterium]
MSTIDPRWERWLEGHGDGGDDRIDLLQVASDPRQAEALVRLAGELVALRQALQGQAQASGRNAEGLPATARRPELGRIALLVASAAALLLALLLWTVAGGDQPDGRGEAASADPVIWQVVDLEGLVRSPGGTLGADAQLPAGTMSTAASTAVLALRQTDIDADIRLHGPFQLRLMEHGHVIRCELGRLMARIGERREDAPVVVETPHARCTVLGTRFTVEVTPVDTRLAVDDGQVAFQAHLVTGGQGPVLLVGPGGRHVLPRPASAEPAQPVRPLVAYRFDRGPAGLAGTGRLQRILPLTVRDDPQWTDAGMLVDARDHIVTATNASWPSLRAALEDSRSLTLSARVRSRAPLRVNQLLATVYIRMADGERRLIALRAFGGLAQTWTRWSVTLDPDGLMDTYRDGELVRSGDREHWPLAPDDLSIEIKVLEPLGHHGEPRDDLAVEFADLLLFDRALAPEELLRLDP